MHTRQRVHQRSRLVRHGISPMNIHLSCWRNYNWQEMNGFNISKIELLLHLPHYSCKNCSNKGQLFTIKLSWIIKTVCIEVKTVCKSILGGLTSSRRMYKTVKPFRKTFYLKFRSPIFSINLYTFIVFIHSSYQGLDNLNWSAEYITFWPKIKKKWPKLENNDGKLVVRNWKLPFFGWGA